MEGLPGSLAFDDSPVSCDAWPAPACSRFELSRLKSSPSDHHGHQKSELYSSLWKSCDELRGGMDASQDKDYVLVLLLVKYVSDKHGGAAMR